MKIGVFDHLQKNDRPELSYQDLFARHLDMVEFLDQAGFDYYFVAEHHFDMGFAECSSPGAWMAAASQRTKRIRLGPLVYVLPLWHPVRVAEEVAMLDNITGGRFECGIGSGIGKYAFAAYGASWENKNDVMWEAYKIIKGMWANPQFSYEGKFFTVRNAELNVPLVQKPHPPLWMPTRSPESVAAAAGEGMSTVQWCPPKMDVVREIFDYYRESYKKSKPAGAPPQVALMREIYVAETDKQAYEEAKDHWIYFWHRVGGGRAYGGYGNENLANITREDRKKELLDVDHAISDNSFICGSPEKVAAQIKQIAQQAGANCFLGEFTFGALEQSKVMKSLRLFADRVMPELRAFEIDALNYPANGYRVWLKPASTN
jgi:alkanesulfonate monooxygenase SsuD/methylene tetrahydromethanopterin reductase-like flavin-dependent oxidoreductase (luciferase family)